MEGTSEKRAGEDNRLKNPIIASSPSPLTVSETAHAFQKDSLSPLTGRRQGRWALLFLLPLSFFIRGRNLRNPPFAVQEESQIAANINKYYDGSFFLNDEPPLSTQIYYGISRVLGFHGTSTYFETEQAFADTEFPFYGLRWVSVVEGVIVVVLTFEILCHYRLTRASVILGSLLVLFENSFATQHRYIFTQPQLLFVDIVHIYLWAALSSTTLCPSAEFNRNWWLFVISTSLCIAIAATLKSAGIFTLVFGICYSTLIALKRLATPGYPIWRVISSWMIQWTITGAIIFGIYFGCIGYHLVSTPNKGEDEVLMSGQFQAQLNGNSNDFQPLIVRYGSLVTLRHGETNGYLHSHEMNYPKGSGQQQVTIYRYRDENNVWMVEPAGGDLVEELTGTAENATWSRSEPNQDGSDSYEGDSFAELEKIGEKLNVSGKSMLDSLINSLTSLLQVPLSLPANPTSELPKTGSYKSETPKKYFGMPVREPIRLRHFITQRRLHSHKVEPPISIDEYQNEVSAYGGVGNIGDDNDVWIVEVYNDEWANKTQPWMSMRTTVRFQHAELGCYLFGHSVNLPEWGLGQLEVTCSFQGKIENSFWYVESNFHPLVANGDIEDEYISYPPIPLFDKFSEYVYAMKGVSDAIASSQFWTWPGRILPVLPDAVPLYKKHHRQVLLFGNYIVWRLSLISLLAYSVISVSRRFLGQRNILVFQQWPAYERSATTLMIAWAAHYIPLLGSTSLDISDYLPALWPSILVFVIVWEYIVQTLLNRPVWHATSCVIIIICVAYVYFVYSPLIYASPWTPKDCSAQEGKWFFDCGEYLNTTEYRLYDPDNFVHYADFARKIRNLTTSGSSKCYGPHPSQVAD